MAFIFGGNTPWSYEELQRQRAVAESLLAGAGAAPRNVGEGLNAIGKALAYRGLTKRAGKEEARMKGEFDQKWGSVFSGGGTGSAPAQGAAFTPSGPPLPPPDPNSPHALGDATMAALGKPAVKTAADPASIKAGLVARGLPEHIADGFVMNMEDESGLNPGINEAAPTVPGSRGGFGLYQLTGPRRVAYEKYASERGVPLDDVDAQLDFMMMELQGPESAAWSKISGAQNAGEAGAAVVNYFLRPAEEHRAARTAEYLGAGGQPQAQPQGGMDLGSLVALAGDPMITPAQKAIVEQLIAQQTQAADPMKAIELEKAQLELAQMKNPSADPMQAIELEKAEIELARLKNPGTEIPKTLQERTALAEEAGIAKGTPEYQKYIATGELVVPGGGSEFGLTPVLGRDKDGKVVVMQLGKDGTAVQTQMPEGVTADLGLAAEVKAEGAAVGKAKGEDEALLSSTASKMAGLETVVAELDTLADQATYTGAGQLYDAGRKQLGLEPRESAVARAEYIAKVDNQVLPMLRDTFGAAFTVKEGETLRATLGDPDKSPAEKKAVLRAFIEQKKRDIQGLETRTGKSAGDTELGLSADDLKYLEQP